MKNKIHINVCRTFIALFDDYRKLQELNLELETLKALELNEYATDEHTSDEHYKVVDRLARVFLNKQSRWGPTDIA